MASRYRPPSPEGRRYLPAERTSYAPEVIPAASSTRRHRESFTSPRSSAERVIPISSETYVNGAPVAKSRNRYDSYDDRRRSTLDAYQAPRASVSSSTGSSSLRPNVVHQNRGTSPLPRSSRYDGDYYITSASSGPRKEHKKVYSVGDGKSARLVGGQDRGATRYADSEAPSRTSDREYRPRASVDYRDRRAEVDDSGSYEYTDPRSMYRDTEPKARTRRGSVDAASRRERPSSMVESYSGKNGTRDQGPPPATRGLDKIGGVSRHDSLSSASGSRARERSYGGSSYSEDDNYRVAPRVSTRRPESMYYDKRDAFSPTRDAYEERPDARRMSRRFEDPDVADRGFGVRAPSIDDRDRRNESVDSRTPHRSESLVVPGRKEYATERTSRDDVRSDTERREVPRASKYEEPQFAVPERPVREKDRDLVRERDIPKDRERGYEEERRHRDRDIVRDDRERDRDRHRDHDRYSDDDYRPREKRLERDLEPDRWDKLDEKKREDHEHDHGSHVKGAAAGTAAAGALALGANEVIKRREHEPRDEPHAENDEKPREDRLRDERVKENRIRDDPSPADRARAPIKGEAREAPIREDESPDAERVRARNYINSQPAVMPEARDFKEKGSDIVDPEEDYRRRVQQEVERVKGTRDDDTASDSDRERRRRDRERRHADGREDSHETASDHFDESRAIVPIDPHRDNSLDASTSVSDAATGSSDTSRTKRVAIVEPPKEKERPKSILRKPTQNFPEDPHPIREGVAPLKAAGKKDIPPGARWTKINRQLVNPQALEEAQERFEERKDCVIVLRVLTKEEIQKYADKTKDIRDGRNYDETDHKESRSHRHHDHDRHHEHDRHDRHGSRREHDGIDDSRESLEGEPVQRQLTWDR